MDCAFEACREHQQPVIVGRGNASASEYDDRIRGQIIRHDLQIDYDLVFRKPKLEQMKPKRMRRNISIV